MPVPQLRQLRDGAFQVTPNIPAAGATVISAALDLGSAPYHPEGLMGEIVIPPLPNQTDPTKTITIQLWDSADGVTFAVVNPLVQTTMSGVAGTGSLGATVNIKLPPTCREFVAISIADAAGDGNNTASTVLFGLLF